MLDSTDESPVEHLSTMPPEIETRMISQEERIVLLILSGLTLHRCERAEQLRQVILLIKYFRMVLIVTKSTNE